MKVFVFFCLVALTCGADLAHREKDVLALLYKVVEPIRDRFTHLKEASQSWTASAGHFKDGGAAATLLDDEIAHHDVLERHHLFSLFDASHRKDALELFDVLINAEDWETFSSAAAHYRELMNEGAFTYALYTAVVHHPLGDGITLPPLYEVNPHMFTNTEVIQKAYTAKMTQTPGRFRMDFTGSKKNPEQRVAYFGEDIGMNVHHVTWHMDYPFWWHDHHGHHLDRKGELFFWMHHQLTARFDAERLSNHLEPVDELYWDRPIHEGFAPHTTYRYGGEFPARPDNIEFEDVDGVARIRDMIIMENRVRDAIAHGYVTARDGHPIDIRNEHGIDILGDVIESSTYSPNPEYYGALHNLAHIVLGRQGDPHGKFKMPPGVMEHFETATRDPAFFRLHKYMDNIFKEHKDSLPPYTHEELNFPGIAIESVTLDGHLNTFFEDFEFDLTMGVDDTPEIADVPLTAVVSRLNHDPFSFTVTVNNNGDARLATFRVFLCPREDSHGIVYTPEEGRWGCIEEDKFWVTLNSGANTVTRKSSEATTTIGDVPSFAALMEEAETGQVDPGHARSCGIPNRLLLPKGTTEGMKFVFFLAITDGSKDALLPDLETNDHGGTHVLCGVHGEKYPDSKPLGFPLDRKIEGRLQDDNPNIKTAEVTVKHSGHH